MSWENILHGHDFNTDEMSLEDIEIKCSQIAIITCFECRLLQFICNAIFLHVYMSIFDMKLQIFTTFEIKANLAERLPIQKVVEDHCDSMQDHEYLSKYFILLSLLTGVLISVEIPVN